MVKKPIEKGAKKGTGKKKGSDTSAFKVLAIVTVSLIVVVGLFAGGKALYNKNSSQNEPEVAGGVLDKEGKSIPYTPLTKAEAKEEPFNDGYRDDNSQVNYLTSKEYRQKIDNKEDFVVYMGRANCPYCHIYRQFQDPVLKDLDKKIDGFDTTYFKGDKTWDSIVKEFDFQYVPEVAVFKKGKLESTMDEQTMFNSEKTVKAWFESKL